MSPRNLPPFRADHVGSLLRPSRLLEARKQKAEGAIGAEELRSVEDEAIREVVRMQGDDDTAALAGQAHALPVTLRFYHPEGFATLLRETIERVRGAVRPESR